MALRLPRLLTDKQAEAREIAIVRFAEQNNIILQKQLSVLDSMSAIMKNVEQMMFLNLDFEKRKMQLEMERLQQEELGGLEASREAKYEEDSEKRDLSAGSLATAAAKLGLKGMFGAVLFGFVAELLDWGRVLSGWVDKFVKVIVKVQGFLNEFGDKVAELTGSKVLGGIIKSLLAIGTALGGLRIVFGPKVFAPFRFMFDMLKKMGDFIGKIKFGTIISKIGDFVKFIPKLLRVVAKIAGPIGLVIAAIEGVIGAVQGFMRGFEEGGLMVGIREGFIGLIDGIVGGLVDMFADLLGWILKQLGFEEIGKKFSDFNFGDFFGTLIDNISYGVELLIHGVLGMVDGVKGFFNDLIKKLDSFEIWNPVGENVSLGAAIPDWFRNWAGTTSQGVAPTPPPPRTAGADAEKSEAQIEANVAEEGKGPPATATPVPAAPPVPAPAPVGGVLASVNNRAAVAGQQVTGGISTFEEAVAKVLKHEGGYVNDPDDPGGETKYGISKRAYPNVDIKNLTEAQAKAIYKRDYWDAIGADQLPANVRYAAFDTAVNMGVGKAKQFIKESGGDFEKFIALRRAHYARIIERNPRLAKFQRGWENRVNDIVAASTGTAPSVSPAPAPSATSGPAISSATMAVAASSADVPMVAPINAPQTTVTNNTTNQAANLSASTPVEFAPHVV